MTASTLVVLLSRDAELSHRLPEALRQLDAGVEVHVVRELQALGQHLKSVRPDALVLDCDALGSKSLTPLGQQELLLAAPVILLGEPPDELAGTALVRDALAIVARRLDGLAQALLSVCRGIELPSRVEEARQHYHDILEASSDGIFVLVGGVFRYVNTSFATALGQSPEQLVGQRSLLDFVAEAQRPSVEEELARIVVGAGRRELLEATLVTASGSGVFEIACRTSVVDGRRALVGVARDVTVARQLQDEIERARRRAAQVERLRALGELAAGVAHDFNNAISTVLGRLGRVRDKLSRGEAVADDLDTMQSAAQHAAATVQRIREFSRPTGSDTWQDIDLTTIVRDAVGYVSTRVPDGVVFDIDLGATPRIQGNATELREVVQNLLSNALDAVGQAGKVAVRCFAEDGKAVLVIADDGEGMSEAVQRRIFEPFFTTKAEHGTGLGLSVSHWILRRHDAQLHLQSEPGTGTVFRIVFSPVATAMLRRARPKKEALTVLVVDDDRSVAEMMCDLLSDEGHEVTVVHHPSEAAQMLGMRRADLMITDLDLPGMSGWQLARKVRELQPDILVGIITGWAVDASEAELHSRGVDFVLAKPFTVEALQRALGQALAGED